MNDCMIIGPPKGTKLLLVICSIAVPIFLYLWITHKSTNILIFAFFMFWIWFFALVYAFVVYNTNYIIDKVEVTRTILNRFSTHIKWTEMKYIGVCKEPYDVHTSGGTMHRSVMLFSKIPFCEYNKPHLFILDRIVETKHLIAIEYIDDETYENILKFSGGERNIE